MTDNFVCTVAAGAVVVWQGSVIEDLSVDNTSSGLILLTSMKCDWPIWRVGTTTSRLQAVLHSLLSLPFWF